MDSNTPSDFEIAAQYFGQNIPIFLREVDNLGNNATRRLLKMLAEYPLNSKEPKFVHEHEKRVYDLGTLLLQCKIQMLNESIKEKKETSNESEQQG